MAKVSVIIPNYNHAKYLPQRIESVLQQTYTDFEVIVLDDCSTDHSREIIQQYAGHPKISQVLYNETNSGSTFIQWKKGFELAKGEYIWIAESDDVAEKDFLETLMQGFELNSDVGIAFCDSIWINEEGAVIHLPSRETIDRVFIGNDFITSQLSKDNNIYNASMAVFKKELLDNVKDQKYLDLKYCGDWYFWVLLAEQCNVYKSCKLLNYFRRHELSVSAKSNKQGLLFIEGLIIFKKIKAKLSFKNKIEIIRHWSNYLFNFKLNRMTYFYIVFSFSYEFPAFLLIHGTRVFKSFAKKILCLERLKNV